MSTAIPIERIESVRRRHAAVMEAATATEARLAAAQDEVARLREAIRTEFGVESLDDLHALIATETRALAEDLDRAEREIAAAEAVLSER